MVTGTSNENGLAVPEKIEVTYTDPYTSVTALRSQSWFDLRQQYLAYGVTLEMEPADVVIADIERNPSDHGKWRWDTPLFDKEVGELIESIRTTNKFEAIWLKKQDGVLSVLDGHHRVIAWQRMGNTTIPAIVITVTPRKSPFQFQ